MLPALLAIPGVLIWLVVGVLVGVVLSRRNYQRQDAAFAFNVRPESAPKWPRQVVYRRHVRDVLVTNRGAAPVGTEFHAVARLATLADGRRVEARLGASRFHTNLDEAIDAAIALLRSEEAQ